MKFKKVNLNNTDTKKKHEIFNIANLIQISLLVVGLATVIVFIHDSNVQSRNTEKSIAQTDSSILIAKKSLEISDSSIMISKRIALTQENFAKIETRAYLVLDSVRIKPFEANKKFVIYYYIANVGKTPANSLRYKLGTKYGGIGVYQRDFDNIKKEVFSESAHPNIGATRNLRIFAQVDRQISHANMSKILRGESKFFVFGIFSYNDVFDETHSLRFCLEFDSTVRGFIFYPNFNDEY